MTAQYKRNLEKTLILIDEMKTGTSEHTVELEASFITVEDDADATNKGDNPYEKNVKNHKSNLKEKISKIKTYAGVFGVVIGATAGILAVPYAIPLIASAFATGAAIPIATGVSYIGTRIAGGVIGTAAGKGVGYAISAFI